jgi:hypothetical protein
MMRLLLVCVSLMSVVNAQPSGSTVTYGQTALAMTSKSNRVLMTFFGVADTWRKTQLVSGETYLVYSTDNSTNVCPNAVGNTTCFPSLWSVNTNAGRDMATSGTRLLSPYMANGPQSGLGVESNWQVSPASQVRKGYVVIAIDVAIPIHIVSIYLSM